MMVTELYNILGKILDQNDGITDIFINGETIESAKLITEYSKDKHGTYVEFKLTNNKGEIN